MQTNVHDSCVLLSPFVLQCDSLLPEDSATLFATALPASTLQSPAWLRAFLTAHENAITTVFLDIAGPHPLQSSTTDLLAALDA